MEMTEGNRREMREERLSLMAYLEEKRNLPLDERLRIRERIKLLERLLEAD